VVLHLELVDFFVELGLDLRAGELELLEGLDAALDRRGQRLRGDDSRKSGHRSVLIQHERNVHDDGFKRSWSFDVNL
jgi:hypothetical protein